MRRLFMKLEPYRWFLVACVLFTILNYASYRWLRGYDTDEAIAGLVLLVMTEILCMNNWRGEIMRNEQRWREIQEWVSGYKKSIGEDVEKST